MGNMLPVGANSFLLSRLALFQMAHTLFWQICFPCPLIIRMIQGLQGWILWGAVLQFIIYSHNYLKIFIIRISDIHNSN